MSCLRVRFHAVNLSTQTNTTQTRLSPARLFLVCVHIVLECHHLLLKGMLCACDTFINYMGRCVFVFLERKRDQPALNMVYYSRNPTATHSQLSFQDKSGPEFKKPPGKKTFIKASTQQRKQRCISSAEAASLIRTDSASTPSLLTRRV